MVVAEAVTTTDEHSETHDRHHRDGAAATGTKRLAQDENRTRTYLRDPTEAVEHHPDHHRGQIPDHRHPHGHGHGRGHHHLDDRGMEAGIVIEIDVAVPSVALSRQTAAANTEDAAVQITAIDIDPLPAVFHPALLLPPDETDGDNVLFLRAAYHAHHPRTGRVVTQKGDGTVHPSRGRGRDQDRDRDQGQGHRRMTAVHVHVHGLGRRIENAADEPRRGIHPLIPARVGNPAMIAV